MYLSDLKDKEWEQIRHHFEYRNGYGNRAIYYASIILTLRQFLTLPPHQLLATL